MEQDLFTFLEHLISIPIFTRVRVAQSLITVVLFTGVCLFVILRVLFILLWLCVVGLFLTYAFCIFRLSKIFNKTWTIHLWIVNIHYCFSLFTAMMLTTVNVNTITFIVNKSTNRKKSEYITWTLHWVTPWNKTVKYKERYIFRSDDYKNVYIYIAMAMKPIHDYIGEFCFSPRVLLKTNKSD